MIATWHDRRIVAGDPIDPVISEYLDTADIVLLLVSADFLASDYCADVEMRRALERHEAGEARVIPVILRPCDWHTAPFGKLLAIPTDGKPLSLHSDLDEGLLDVVRSIRAAVRGCVADESPTASAAVDSGATASANPRSSNLRVPSALSDRDRSEFVFETFEYIANYFTNSLAELSERNPSVEHTLRRGGSDSFTAAVFVDGKKKAGCRVSVGSSIGDIAYSASDDAPAGSCNEWLTVEHDGYTPSLRSGGMGTGANSHTSLTQEGAAECLWGMLMEPLQRQ